MPKIPSKKTKPPTRQLLYLRGRVAAGCPRCKGVIEITYTRTDAHLECVACGKYSPVSGEKALSMLKISIEKAL